jgi:hypothetical protein
MHFQAEKLNREEKQTAPQNSIWDAAAALPQELPSNNSHSKWLTGYVKFR